MCASQPGESAGCARCDRISPRAARPARLQRRSAGRRTPTWPARIREAVMARLGNQVDPALLDIIIKRVLKSTGVK